MLGDNKTAKRAGVWIVGMLLFAATAWASYQYVIAQKSAADGNGNALDSVEVSVATLNGQAVNVNNSNLVLQVNPGDILYMEGQVYDANGMSRSAAPASFIWTIQDSSGTSDVCDLTSGDPSTCSQDYQVTGGGVTYTVPQSMGQAATVILTSNIPTSIDASDPNNPVPNSDTLNLNNASYQGAMQVKIVSFQEVDPTSGQLITMDPTQSIFVSGGQLLYMSAGLMDNLGNAQPSQASDYVWSVVGAKDTCSMSSCPQDSQLQITPNGVAYTGQSGVDSLSILVYSQNPSAQDSTGVSSTDTAVIYLRPAPQPDNFDVVRVTAINDDYDLNHAREIFVRPGAKISLSVDLLQSNLYFQPANDDVEDFVWSVDGNSNDVCDASASIDCLINSQFQVTDVGVDFYTPYDMGDAIVIRVMSHNPATVRNGVQSSDYVILRNVYGLQPIHQMVLSPFGYPYDHFVVDYGLAGLGRWVTIGGVEYFSPYTYVFDGGEEWAPYRHGYWIWIEGEGMSWVSYDPWGWITDHYGIWRYHSLYGWLWLPFRDRHYIPHGCTFFYDDNYIGWYPYHAAWAEAYRDGRGDGYHEGFQDGFWEGERAAHSFAQNRATYNIGVTLIDQHKINHITGIKDVVDVYEHIRVGGLQINVTVQTEIINGRGFGPHLGGQDVDSSRAYVFLRPGARVEQAQEVTLKSGDKIKTLPQDTPSQAYQQVGSRFTVSSKQPTRPVGTITVASRDAGNGIAKIADLPPTTNGRGVAPAPRVIDPTTHNTVQVINVRSKTPAAPQPPSVSPQAAAQAVFKAPPAPPQPKVKAVIGFDPQKVAKAPAIAPQPTPTAPPVKIQAPPVKNVPPLPPLPKATTTIVQKSQSTDAAAKAAADAAANAKAAKAKADADAAAAKAASDKSALQKVYQAAQAAANQADAALKQAQAKDQANTQAVQKAQAAAQAGQQAVANAKKALTDAQAAQSGKNAAVQTAQGKVTSANTAQQAVQKDVTAAQAAVGPANSAVTNAQQNLQTVQTAQQAAITQNQSQVTKLQAQVQPAAQAVQAATSAQAGAQAEASKASAALSQAQGALPVTALQQAKSATANAQSAVNGVNAQIAQAKGTLASALGQTSSAQTQLNSANSQVQAAAAQANAAQAQVNSAQAAVQKNPKDANAQHSLQNAQAALQSAKQAQASAQAAAAQAQNSVKSAQAEAAQAQASVNAAQGKLAGVQQALSQAQAVEANAQSAWDKANQTVTAASDQVKSAQDVLNKANQALNQAKANEQQVSQGLSSAQNQIQAAQAKITAAQQDVQKAQAAKANADKAVTDAQAKVTAAVQAVQQAQTELAQAQSAKASADAAVQTAGKAVNDASASAAPTAATLQQAQAAKTASAADVTAKVATVQAADARAAASKKAAGL